MRSLYARLAVALVAIVISLGVAFFLIARFATNNYYQEITQRLNADIAAHIAAEQILIDAGGVNAGALESIAHQAMVINPSVEVYLLDPDGRILGHAAPPGKVKREDVALEPVRRFLSGESPQPLFGDDPRDATRQKIFSAAPVERDGLLLGYVYTILGGEKYDDLANKLDNSYIFKLSLGAIIASLLLAAAIGLVIFALLTRRLRRLSEHVDSYARSDFRAQTPIPVSTDQPDELDRLALTFNAMAGRIGEQLNRLEETDRQRRELITNISHDLRTPLASMQGYIDTLLLKDHELSPEQRNQYLGIASEHGERLSRLVAELFELAVLDAGSVAPNLEQFSLSELLQDVSQEFRLRANSQQVALKIDTLPENCVVLADIGLIQRVLENLIENALRYTPRGGAVRIGIATDADRVGVSVADTGCGIEADIVPRIFDRFYHPNNDDGTGLGLAIVKKIIDLHDGQIVVESQVDVGTRFTFDLPSAAA